MIKLPLMDRFIKFVDKTSSEKGCWIWTRGKFKSGYGTFNIAGKTISTHRVSWMLFKGEIPEGKQIRHNCDNPPCVNPDHLELGINADNVQDRVDRERSAMGNNNGSRLHPEKLARGEKNGRYTHPEKTAHKIPEEQIKEIRILYIEKLMTQKELADRFNTTQQNISKILNNKTWKRIK